MKGGTGNSDRLQCSPSAAIQPHERTLLDLDDTFFTTS